MNIPQKKCIIVCGPTASGKTDYAIRLAKLRNTSIISADSRQCYRELTIGVAKPTPHQLAEVPHYFINTHSVKEEVTVKTFETYAIQTATDIFKEKDVVVMCGGTGLFIKAFAEGLDDIPPIPSGMREMLASQYEKKGMEWLFNELTERDKRFAAAGEMKNPQRMLRALEVVMATGRSVLDYHNDSRVGRDFFTEYIVLNPPRDILYERINARVDKMMNDGLLEEARQVYPLRHLNALQTVGYQELFRYLDGELSLEEAVSEIKKNTRRYAKRQITWFKKYAV